jgi:hypothetical protein
LIYKQSEFGWGGLNTRATATGLPLLECTALQDFRVVGRDLVQRKGMVRVGQVTGNQSALDFAAASSESLANTIDTRAWSLGLYWSLEFVIEPDTVAGTQGLMYAGHTTPAMALDITGGNIRYRVWDSANTLTTVTVGTAATSVQSVLVTRSGATISTQLNNGTAVTGAISATLDVRAPVGELRVANDETGNFYDGTICKFDLFSIVKSHHKDRLVRCQSPRASYVRASYDFNVSAGLLAYDRSRYEAHLIAANTPTEITTLCHNPAPIRGLSMTPDAATKRKSLLVMAGGSYYVCDAD